jgi:hypothetical protein
MLADEPLPGWVETRLHAVRRVSTLKYKSTASALEVVDAAQLEDRR